MTPLLTISSTGLGIIFTYYFAAQFGLSPSQRAYVALIGSIGGITGLLFAGPVSDRILAFRPGRVFVYFGLVQLANVASIFVLVASNNLALNILMGVPIGFALSLVGPALSTIYTLVVPARIRGLGGSTGAPFTALGLILTPFVVNYAQGKDLRTGLIVFIPILVAALLIIISVAPHVDRDIRAARAASLADEEARRSRESGRNKMVICRDVDVTYDGVQVLFGVDFDVEEGEIVALLGTNGAGKSTLMRAICGIQEASNGAVFLDGDDITHVPPHLNAARGIVFMPGGQAVFPTLTVAENLRLAAWLYKSEPDYVAERTESVLTFFPVLRERLGEQAGSLSGGEQQMLALGQALLMRPRLLMIDELSLGLAPQVVEQLLETVRSINAQGTTIVLVEQSVNVALTVAERAVFMDKGEIRFDGPVAELLARNDIMKSVFFGGAAAGGVVPASRRARGESDREPFLVVRDIAVSFGGIQALRGASVDVRPGEIVGLLGPNGAGKTTLFDVISGFVTPDAGSVLLGGEDVTDVDAAGRARLGLGRSFQNVRLFPALTVRENLAVAMDQRVTARNPLTAALWSPTVRRTERAIARRVDELVGLLRLRPYADRYPNELSTGTRRTVDIACILASEPRMLLLDEPTSGLAQAETEELGPVLQRLVRETGAGLLVIEHDLVLLASISERMVAMELGADVVAGTPAEVLNDARVLKSYISGSEDVLLRSGSKDLAQIVGAVQTVDDPAHTSTSQGKVD
jgi:branched-chain amino acid transport system ATP-binding protein